MLPATAPILSCPQCHTPVRAGDTVCRSCGINLALAAALAEGYTRATRRAARGARGTAELPRFGEFLVSQGFITSAELWAGLDRQRESAALGTHQAIGHTLVAMGVISRERLDQAGIQQVRQLQVALEENNRRLELRTPLVPIKGFSDPLLNGSLGVLSDSQCEAIETISRSTLRLDTLTSQLIQFASSVKGKRVINPTIIHVPDLVEPLWDYFQPKAEAAGVTLARDVPDRLPLALADAEKMYWVLYQLLDNAIKFTQPGGQVIVSATAGPASMRLSVRDTGAGISPENLSRIFEPFAQAAGTPGQLVDGIGLGLALVKRIVDAHNSRVEVESQLGRGSTFAFELPLSRPAPAA
jgi:signal transduction histidine kinase